MIDFSKFKQKFSWDPSSPFRVNKSQNTKVFIGTMKRKGDQSKRLEESKEGEMIPTAMEEVIIKQVTYHYTFKGSLEEPELVKIICRSLDEWAASLACQGTHGVRVKGMSIRFVLVDEAWRNYDLETYMCFEKFDCDLRKYYLEDNQYLHPSDYKRLVQSCLEALQFFEVYKIYHSDIKPSNIVLRRLPQHSDGSSMEFKMIDFGVGKVDSADMTEQFSQGVTNSRGYTPIRLKMQVLNKKQLDSELRRFNDKYMMGMTLFSIGSKMGAPTELEEMGCWLFEQTEANKTGRLMLQNGFAIIHKKFHPWGEKYVDIIKKLLEGKSKAQTLLRDLQLDEVPSWFFSLSPSKILS